MGILAGQITEISTVSTLNMFVRENNDAQTVSRASCECLRPKIHLWIKELADARKSHTPGLPLHHRRCSFKAKVVREVIS